MESKARAEIKKAMVVGSGIMGPGVALGFALGGLDVAVTDIDEGALDKGRETIDNALSLFKSRGLLPEGETPSDIVNRIEFTGDMSQAAVDVDLAIEAVSENPEVKEKIYRQLDGLLGPDAIIGSNTSSLPVPLMYPDIRPGRLIIIHYFNPAHIMPLVEIVRAEKTPDYVIDALRDFYKRIGKYVVVLEKFLPGFLINRIQVAVMREVLFLLEEGLCGPAEIDTAFKVSSALRGIVHGPFEHMDMIGLDTVEAASKVVFPLLSNTEEVPKVIEGLVKEGKLGFKGSGGFYDYPEDEKGKYQERRDRAILEEVRLFKELVSKGDISIKEP